jgi:hypothetical protein
LRWHANVTRAERPTGFDFEAWGDLEGPGSWRFDQDGAWCDLIYDWRLRANKPAVRLLSPVLKPLLAANFRSLFDKGETSLRLELARRHASEAQRQGLPSPPPLTSVPVAPLLVGVGALVAFTLLRRSAKRRQWMSSEWRETNAE